MLDCQITCIFKNRVTPIPRTKPPRSTASGLFQAIALTSLQSYRLPNYEASSRNFRNLQPALVSKHTSLCSPNLVSVGVNMEMNKRQVRGLPQSDNAVRVLTGQDSFPSAKRRRCLRNPPRLVFDGHRGLFARCTADEAWRQPFPPSSDEITNGSTPPTCFTAWTGADLPFI